MDEDKVRLGEAAGALEGDYAEVKPVPCPWCEHDADEFYYNGPGPPPSYAVQCGWCHARGPCMTGSRRDDHEGAKRRAVEEWNRGLARTAN